MVRYYIIYLWKGNIVSLLYDLSLKRKTFLLPYNLSLRRKNITVAV